MHQGWLLIGLSLAYLGVLFLIAYVADKSKRRRLKGQPLLYSLSLAVYCTSWTFFGTVGQASESPWSPVPIYLGPMLVFLFGWRLLARLIPDGMSGEIFGLYATTGRAVSFLSPLLFGAGIAIGELVLGSSEAEAQYWGILGVVVVLAAGLALAVFVKDPTKQPSVAPAAA